MSFNFAIPLDQEPVDWDQFLIDADLGQTDTTSPAPSDSQTATPRSTESEQSQALDITDADFDIFNFGLDPLGIMHQPEDIYNPLSAFSSAPPAPEKSSSTDPNFTASFGDFTDFAGFGNDALAQLGLSDLLETLVAPQPEPAHQAFAEEKSALSQAYAALGWSAPPAPLPTPTVQPANLSIPPPTPKRKSSSDSNETVAKRPRGRPPKSSQTVPAAKRRRQSKTDESPLSKTVSFADEDADADSEGPNSPKLTISGKPSTARPKSVVPEKYLKDGSAQAILGMTIDEIQAFPTFDDLLKQVEPSKQTEAAAFGARIADNRDKAKDAAKKSREERKAKIDFLENKVDVMQKFLQSLVVLGKVSEDDIAAYME